jgi:hypothetical protein
MDMTTRRPPLGIAELNLTLSHYSEHQFEPSFPIQLALGKLALGRRQVCLLGGHFRTFWQRFARPGGGRAAFPTQLGTAAPVAH